MKDFTETPLQKESVYQGKFLRLNRDTVRLPNGRQSVREYLSHPGAAMVVPVLDGNRVIMVRQYRYSVSRHIIEFPAGKIDRDETGEMAARRELLEETGYDAASCEPMYCLHPCVAYASEQLELFCAQGLRHVGHPGEENEFVEVLELPVARALDMTQTGEITDSKAVLGLLWLARRLGI
jgi:ADP-ribose pyrophosphatase